MIKIAKKRSYNRNTFPSSAGRLLFGRITLYVILFIFLYIFLPFNLAKRAHFPFFKLPALFYLANILIVSFLINNYYSRKNRLKLAREDLQEKLNICYNENSNELKNKFSLQQKISRYSNLKDVIEKINESLELEAVADTLAGVSFSLIVNNKGNCILYLVDNQTYRLNLFKAKKENEDLIIKSKEGDMFDLWVLKHASPLIIEDSRKDFRFDPEKLKAQATRAVSSLIIAPLISDHKFLGLLRLDSAAVNSYSQEDLRLLVTVCDFGGIALENGELFKKTQDLAIHDGLTSLYTKGYFLERLREECKRAMRKDNSFTLLMLDIDHFKEYNDKFGHTAGDIVLKELSRSITGFFKGSNSIISRFGGEEFCVILPASDKKKGCDVAEQLRLSIEKMKIVLRKQETRITASIGVTSCPDDSCDENELIFKSDRAMYEAKQKGRNRVCGI